MEGYPYIGKLAGDADAIIIADISAFKQSYNATGSYLPLTDFEVNVERSLKGDLQKGDKITLEEVGSTRPAGAVSDAYDLVEVGRKYLLFLDYYPEKQVYYPLGGPQGKYMVTDGKVYSMDTIDPAKYNFVKVRADGKPLELFVAEVSDAVRNPEASKPVEDPELPDVPEIPEEFAQKGTEGGSQQ